MKKLDVVLVVLNRDALDDAVKKLNFDNVNVALVLTDGGEKSVKINDKKIPIMSFSAIHLKIRKYKNFIWAIVGCGMDKLRKVQKYVMSMGVPEDNIVHFEVAPQFSPTWLANLRHVEEHGADYFVTGNEYIQNDFDLKFVPCAHEDKSLSRGGVILADGKQDLRQSYQIAKHVFAHVAPGTIKFVVIGLTAYALHYDNAKDFLHSSQNLQYTFAGAEETAHDKLLQNLLVDDVKNIFAEITAEQADLNFDAVKKNYTGELSGKGISDWDDATKSLTSDAVEENVQILTDYIQLCLDNGAKPVLLCLPFGMAEKKIYKEKYLPEFREKLAQLEENYDIIFLDLFERFLYDCFCEMRYLNNLGRTYVGGMMSMKLNAEGILPAASFRDMNYEYFRLLAVIAQKDEYNALMDRIFAKSAEIISRKPKIKIGFVLYFSSEWCGDDLYNLFVQNEQFETTVFLCLPNDSRRKIDIVKEDFLHGVEQFLSHKIRVIAVTKKNAIIPTQDVIIFLKPYLFAFSNAFHPKNLTVKTLICHIPYGIGLALRNKSYYDLSIFKIVWKLFFTSNIELKIYDKEVKTGMSHGVYSGYPRMDIFFEDNVQFHFDWKMTHPDAKKIIWAPHWSINGGIRQATFQWNYEFMYEFAKAHPEISWVVKPHQNLLYSAVKEKIFSTMDKFKEYLQKWNDLPNAQVYTGAYYQDIFATSDGMIHDCGSFIGEYQYANKPMIFLRRDTQRHNELGKKILSASYLVDGQDLDGIAAMMQRVFIEGDDYKADERKKIFDKYLNYPKANGMLASEFIYKSIADEFKTATE